jgi:hypothetical protein
MENQLLSEVEIKDEKVEEDVPPVVITRSLTETIKNHDEIKSSIISGKLI